MGQILVLYQSNCVSANSFHISAQNVTYKSDQNTLSSDTLGLKDMYAKQMGTNSVGRGCVIQITK